MPRKLRAVLLQSLSPSEIATVSTSYDIVGDVAILRPLAEGSSVKVFAAKVMEIHRNVKTVLSQEGRIAGDFRLRPLAYVAGEDRRVTRHREFGCLFSVDLERSYFSTRLSHERLRLSKLVQPGEIVVNMFAGVGCFSILIAKRSNPQVVFSIDISYEAVSLMRENIRLNSVYGKVVPLLGDSEKIVKESLQGVADRVLMPLPEKAFEYLPAALSALKWAGGWVHLYDFQHAGKGEDPVEKTKICVAEKMSKLGYAFQFGFSRVVRSVGPNWYQVVVDFRVFGGADKS